jgi:hypothetical protein
MGNMFESLLNSINNDSERFQQGLFTAFYTFEKMGFEKEKIFKIFDTWDKNNSIQNKDFQNLQENYIQFCKIYEEAQSIANDIKNK